MKNQNKLITSAMAAKLSGFSPDYIRRLILDGKIKAIKIGHDYLMLPKDIAHIKRKRFPREDNSTRIANDESSK